VSAVDEVVLPEPPGLHLLLDELPVLHRGHESRTIGSSAFLSYASSFLSRPDDVCIVGVQRQNPFHVARFEMADERLVHAATMASGDCSAAAAGTASSALSASISTFRTSRAPLDRGPGADA